MRTPGDGSRFLEAAAGACAPAASLAWVRERKYLSSLRFGACFPLWLAFLGGSTCRGRGACEAVGFAGGGVRV